MNHVLLQKMAKNAMETKSGTMPRSMTNILEHHLTRIIARKMAIVVRQFKSAAKYVAEVRQHEHGAHANTVTNADW